MHGFSVYFCYVKLLKYLSMKEFIKNFSRQKAVGFLNVSSLSLGIMVSIIVGLLFFRFAWYESHCDKSYPYSGGNYRNSTRSSPTTPQ